MKKYISKIKKKTIWGSLFLAAGIFLGWVLFHPNTNGNHPGDRPTDLSGSPEQVVAGTHDHSGETTWTCSMHPQIRREEPGQCPICGMDLIPVSDMNEGGQVLDPEELGMTESAAKLAEVQTLRVERGRPVQELLLQGKVKADERRISVLTARFGGRIEKLYVNFTGERVQQGEKLASLYSPELVTAQRELIEAARGRDEQPGLYRAARSRLELWDLTGAQIDAIIEKGEPVLYFDVRSPIGGTVTKKHVSSGDYVNEGSALFEVIDLTRVWIMFDAYESDLPWISKGDKVSYQLQSFPGQTFTGRVAYIDPFIHPDTRVAGIRVEQDNPRLIFKPEMFVRGKVESQIAGGSEALLIPSSSILWTGKRAVVYVRVPDRDRPTFRYREITLGPAAGDQYVVESGLQEGEEIVVNGVFRIDAAAQLAGKPSMMNREGGEVAVTVEAFKKQLQELFQTYISMKDAFVESDPHKVAAFGQDLHAALEAVDVDLLNPDAHVDWMHLAGRMNQSLETISERHDIEIQRNEFAGFNQALYEAVKAFGLQEGTIYYQFCPMALDNNGAYWLSTSEEIRNPYFGDAMLRCGETRETFEF